MTRSSETTARPRRPVRRALRTGFSLVIGSIVFSLFYLVTFGFPEWLRDEALRRVSSGDFAIFASAVRLNPLHGVSMKNVRVYRKGVVGPAALEAVDVTVTVGIPELVSGTSCMRQLTVRGGVFRPVMLHCPGRQGADGTGRAPLDLQVDLEDFMVQGVPIERVSFRLSSYGETARYERISGRVGAGPMAGPVTGDINFDTGACRLSGRLTTEFNLHAMMPIFKAWEMGTTIWLVESFDFGDRRPRCEATFEKICTENGRLVIDGRFWTENSTYNGVQMLRADGRVRAELTESNSWITVDPVLVVRKEGIAKGSFTVRPDSRTVEFEAESTLHPVAVSKIVGVLTNGVLDMFDFRGPVKVDGKGVATYGVEPPGHDFVLNINGREMGLGLFTVEQYSFTSMVAGNSNAFSNIRGRCYGGDFSGSAAIRLPEGTDTSIWYRVEGKAEEIDFGKFAAAMTRDEEKDYSGRMWLEGRMSGLAGPGGGRTVRGGGAIGVKDGRVFMLPIFGGLSSLMVKIIPGLDFVLRQSDAEADIIIDEGRVHSRKVKIEGDILSLQGRGHCGFDGTLDYEAQIKLMKEHTLVGKLLRGITYPLTKLFEFRLTGTPGNPKWYPVNFSTDLLRKMGLTKDVVEEHRIAVPE